MPVEFAMPAGTSIDRGATIVVGDKLNWYGTLALTSDTDTDGAHQCTRTNCRAKAGSRSRPVSNRVVLQFINRRQSRAGIVTIEPRTVGGTHIEISWHP